MMSGREPTNGHGEAPRVVPTTSYEKPLRGGIVRPWRRSSRRAQELAALRSRVSGITRDQSMSCSATVQV